MARTEEERERERAREADLDYRPGGLLALQNPLQFPTPPPPTDPDEDYEPTGPMVSTDRPDYRPGETAQITGTRFHPNETVTLRITHTDGTAEGGEGHESWTAATDAEGNFSAEWFVNPDDSEGSSFKLTADCPDGLHAQYFFTDAGPVVASGYSIREVASGGLLAGQILDGVVADSTTGNVYVAGVSNTSSSSMNLYKITPAGAVSLVGTYAFGHNEVVKMAMGPDGKIYTVDKNTGNVKTINPATGASATFATGACAGCRYGLNFDPAGNLILGYESMFDFYKVTPGGLTSLGHVSASVPSNNHGDSFGIQPDGNYVVYVDCGGKNNYSINTAGHAVGTNYTSLAWTGTTDVFTLMPGACGYSNGAIDPNTGEVYSTISNFGSGNSAILYTGENGGASSLFVSGASGITDLTFGKSSAGSCNSLYFVDRVLNKVFEVPMNNCCSPMPDPVTVSGGGEFCETATITAGGGGGGTIYFQGTTSRGTSTDRPSNSEVVTTSGTYYFRSLSPSGCWGKQGSVTVTIKPAPATPVISPSGPIEYHAGSPTTTTLSIPAPAVSPAKTYNIPLASLVSLPFDCGSGSRYSDVGGGFTWNDTGAGVATNVQVKFSVGVECSVGAHTSSLNNVASSGFNTTTPFCSCGVPPSPQIITLNLNPSSYNVSGANTFLMSGNTFGLIPAAALGNNYAQVTVTYGAPPVVWSPGGQTTNSITVSPTSTTTYTVTVTGQNGCSSSSSKTITVLPRETPTLSVTGGTFTYDGNPHPATGFAYGAGGVGDVLTPALTFTYTDANGNTSSSPPTAAGIYAVNASYAGNAAYTPVSQANAATVTILSGDCTTIPSGMAAWYPGEGSAADVIGDNDGTPLGGLTFPAGESGQALGFNGIDAGVKVPAAPALNVGAGGGLTVELWVNPSNLNERSMVEWNNSAGGIGAHFNSSVVSQGAAPGNLYSNLIDTGGNSHIIQSAGGFLHTNQWQHAALTYDKATGMATIYLNGVAIAGPTNIGVFTPQTGYDLYLGERPSGGDSGFFGGRLDEVHIFNRALSSSEIQALYLAASHGICNTAPVAQAQSVVTDEDTAAAVTLAATDAEGNFLSYTVIAGPAHGTLSGTAPNLTYTPAPNYSGPDSFTFKANDDSLDSNVATVSINVNPVNDAPVAVCQEVTKTADDTGHAAVSAAEVNNGSSDVENDPLTLALVPSGPFGAGATPVTLTVTDAGGASSSCTATVNVVDSTPPVISNVPADMTVEATGPGGAAAAWATPTATDNVDGSVPVNCAPASGSVFPLGTSTVQCTATDAHGNVGHASFTVKVQDTTPPSITCPAPATVEADTMGGAHFTPSAASATDTVSAVNVSGPAAGSYPLGTTALNYTATDESGNLASCNSSVTVQDTTPPVLSLPADFSTTADESGTATVTYSATATDIASVPNVVCDPASGSQLAPGFHTVNCTAADGSGNNASGSFKVTVFSNSCTFIPSGAIAWYPGDGATVDIVGGNDGTVQGGVPFTAGHKGQALQLGSGYVQVPNSPALESPTVSVALWARSHGAGSPGVYNYLVSKGSGGCSGGTAWGLETDNTGGLKFVAGGGTSPDPGAAVWDGNWHHFVGTYDGSSLRLYVDGIQVGGGTPNSAPIDYASAVSRDLLIGKYEPSNGCGYNFNGDIDEVQVFSRALSASEAQALYLANNLGACPPPPTTTAVQNAGAVYSPADQSMTLTATVTPSAGTVNDGSVLFTVKTGGGSVVGSPVTAAVSGDAASASFTLPGGTAVQTLNVTATYVSSVPDFQTSDGAGTLDITKATPVITWATPSDITYGTALSAAQLNAAADVPGSFAYTPAAGTVLQAGGGQTLSTLFTPADAANYNTATKAVSININKATLNVRADDKSKTYGDPAVTFTVSYDGFVNGDTPASLGGTLAFNFADSATNPAGSYTIKPSGLTSANYAVAFADGTLTVAQKALTVTADDKSRRYGEANPPLTVSYGGFVNGEGASALGGTLQFALNADPTSPVGVYAITPSGYTSSNYIIMFVPGTLTIGKAEQTINWNNPATVVYGTALSAAQLNAAVSVVGPSNAGAVTYTPAAGTVLHAGAHQPLTVNVAETPNYSPATKTVYLDVQKATPVITWNTPAAITYGTALSATQLNATAAHPTVAGSLSGQPVAGSFAYTPAAGAVPPVGDDTLSVTFTPTNAADYTTATKAVVLRVNYGVCVLYDQTKAAKSGSTIPIKLALCSASGANLSSSAVVVNAIGTRLISTNPWGGVADAGNAHPDMNFRFAGDNYLFNLQTKGLTTGVYQLGFTVGADPTVYTVQFQVK